VLLIGVATPVLERIAPMLRRVEFEVHTATASEGLLDLIQNTPFELLLVAYPIGELPVTALTSAVRSPSSACRRAALALLTESDDLEEASRFTHAGANRALSLSWAPARLWLAISDLLEVAPRAEMRAPVRLEVSLSRGRGRAEGRTHNVSRTGMLLGGIPRLEPGQEFDFELQLPDHAPTINGQAHVVRVCNPSREIVRGLGARFSALSTEDRDQISLAVERALEKHRDEHDTGDAALLAAWSHDGPT
jgi:hypothetical protein